MEHLAGAAASSVAECCGFTPAQAKDIEVAVCEACTSLAGRFFVGACQRIVILIAVHPRRLRVTVFGDSTGRCPELAETPLDPHDTDMSLGVLRALMDSVAVLLHGQRGFCVVMSKRRFPTD